VPRDLKRVVVSVDPSGTRGEEDQRSDNIGIVAVGLGMDNTAYVLADRTCNLPPEGWARVAVTAYREFKADRIVAEQNRNVPVNLVNASRGKTVRAEPVSALYGYERDGSWRKDQVRHAGEFREIEDQMLNFSTAGYLGDRSPDRVDALVWALTDLLVEPEPGHAMVEYYRLRAREAAEKKAAAEAVPRDPAL
jgi:phage terminase large subunit-like protein